MLSTPLDVQASIHCWSAALWLFTFAEMLPGGVFDSRGEMTRQESQVEERQCHNA